MLGDKIELILKQNEDVDTVNIQLFQVIKKSLHKRKNMINIYVVYVGDVFMTDIFDDKMSLSEFKQLYNTTPEARESFLSSLKAKYIQQEAVKPYWKNEKEQIEKRLARNNNEKVNLTEEIKQKNAQLSEMQDADTFFKNYQKNTLNNIISAAPDAQSGVAICADLHKAIQEALQTGNIEHLKQDIAKIKAQHVKQNFFTKMLKRQQNKKLDEALNLAVGFVKAQKDKINNNPTLKEKFCSDQKAFNEQETLLTQEIDTLNSKILSIDHSIEAAQTELKQIDSNIEKNVQSRIDNIAKMPEIYVSADKIAKIVIEDEANIKQAASFNMNFIKEGYDGKDSNLDITKANKAAKLIAAAGFPITDNPEEAKNTGSFYLKKGEIYTPFIAKEDLPKYKALLAMLRENGAEPTNLNIPTQPEQILREKTEPQNIDVSALISEAAQLGEHKTYGGPSTEVAITQKYNDKDFLYRGTMSSDATYAGSARSGRQGIIYATNQIVDAAAYSGSKSQYGAGLSGTGDKYADNEITYIKDGKETKGYIGFIHVYENHNNKMYNNWEIENKTYTEGDKDYETFLKTENKHVATYLTVSSPDGRQIDTVFEIPRNDPRWQAFLKSKEIDPKLTYQNGREELFERMQTQLAEVKQDGKVKTVSFASMRTATSEEQWQEITRKTTENSVSNSYTPPSVQETPPPPVQESMGMTPPPPPVQGYTGATPPPPPVQGYAGATPPPPPVQGYTGATPPPPPVQGYTGATPPPPPVQGYAGATPPPIEQTTQKFTEMSPKEQGKAILSMRKGINPLLPKVTDVSSMTNTQTKTLSQTQKQSMSSIINSYSSRNR